MIHNLHPAKVINISMGTSSASTCGSSDPVQQALNAVNALPDPPIVVTAAGNFGDQGLKASQSYPGNCGGTINVGATGNTGDKSFYTNLGWGSGTYSGIDISAPGGDYNPSQSINNGLIAVASNSGPTTQVSGGVEYVGEEGTSFSAPIVAGVIALMASVKPNLTISSAISILDATDTPFAAGTKCQRLTAAVNRTGYYECGPGIVNAGAAVAAALAAN
jgi:serine protease